MQCFQQRRQSIDFGQILSTQELCIRSTKCDITFPSGIELVSACITGSVAIDTSSTSGAGRFIDNVIKVNSEAISRDCSFTAFSALAVSIALLGGDGLCRHTIVRHLSSRAMKRAVGFETKRDKASGRPLLVLMLQLVLDEIASRHTLVKDVGNQISQAELAFVRN